MLKVGLTGGIGAGKSIITKLLGMLNVPIYIADIEAKRIINSTGTVKQQLIDIFGEKIYTDKGINRPKFASLIFNNEQLLAKVNNIVRPAVNEDFEKWCASHIDYDYVVYESAILIESGASENFDFIVCVLANINNRIKRAMCRDNASREKILARVNNQMQDSEKVKKSDYIIYNSQSDMLITQVLKLNKILREKNN